MHKQLSIKKNMIWNSMGSFTYLVCQWLITVLVVRLTDNYAAAGTLALGMTVANLVTPFGYYKIRAYQVSDVNESFSPNQYLAHRIITCILSFIFAILYALATCDSRELIPITLYILFAIGPVFSDVLDGICQQRNRMDIIGISMIIRGIGTVSVFAVALFLSQSLEIALIGMTLVSYGVIFLYNIPQVRMLGPSLIPEFKIPALKTLFINCFPAVLALFFCNAVPSIPRQILGMIEGTSALGIYASVAAPVTIIQMGAQYIYSPLLGLFGSAYSSKKYNRFIRLCIKVLGAIMALTVAAIIAAHFLGTPALALLYGGNIANYVYLLPPLLICATLTALIWFVGDLLIVIRDTKGVLYGYLLSFAACALTSNILIEHFSLNGCSYATMISLFLGILFCYIRMVITLRSQSNLASTSQAAQ